MTRELSLQPRLALLASLVPQGAVLADVGTDHGYIPVCLRQRGVIDRAIASDIGREPLEHARRTAEEYGVGGIDLRLCAGLDAIAPEECDTVLIAGMGGETIWGILAAAPWTRDGRHTLLLQPQTKIEELRLRLCENGYAVTREHLVRDKGKLYVVMTVTAGERYTPGAEQLYGGLALEREALYGDYLAHQIARLRRRAEGLRQSGSGEADGFAALADEAAGALLCYGGAPAAACYHSISNGVTEASQNVWTSALPYLQGVASPWDKTADGYETTITYSCEQVDAILQGLGLEPETLADTAPAAWFGAAQLDEAGYVASMSVCGEAFSGTRLRRALALRSTCFAVQYADGTFTFTTRGYGHCVGLSQHGAQSMAEGGADWREILTYYFPGCEVVE